MIFKCRHCLAKLKEDDVMRGICPHCHKICENPIRETEEVLPRETQKENKIIIVQCPHCNRQNQIPDDTLVNTTFVCPFCGKEWYFLGQQKIISPKQQRSLSKGEGWGLIFLLVIATLGLWAPWERFHSSSSVSSQKEQSLEKEAMNYSIKIFDVYSRVGSEPDYDIKTGKIILRGNKLSVSGRMKNTGRKTISYSVLRIKIWNKSDHDVIANEIIYPASLDLEPGETTTFADNIYFSIYTDNISWNLSFENPVTGKREVCYP